MQTTQQILYHEEVQAGAVGDLYITPQKISLIYLASKTEIHPLFMPIENMRFQREYNKNTQKYQNMTLDEMEKADKQNKTIPNEKISNITIELGRFGHTLKITTQTGHKGILGKAMPTQTLNINIGKDYTKLAQTLKTLFGNKFKCTQYSFTTGKTTNIPV